MCWKFLIVWSSTISSFVYATSAAYKHVSHENQQHNYLHYIWEGIFLIDFVMSLLFVDYLEPNPEGKAFIQRNYKSIAIHYYQTDFWTDFIPLLPL